MQQKHQAMEQKELATQTAALLVQHLQREQRRSRDLMLQKRIVSSQLTSAEAALAVVQHAIQRHAQDKALASSSDEGNAVTPSRRRRGNSGAQQQQRTPPQKKAPRRRKAQVAALHARGVWW